jgi:hypothetical protein
MKRKFFATLIFAVGFLIGLDGGTARADLADYISAVNLDTTKTFLATNVTPLPMDVNIGTLSGNNTYEFIANSISDTNGSEALLASSNDLGGQAIKFEQWEYTGVYGATQYYVADYSYSTATTFNSNVFLDFVVSPAAQKTELFVNGVNTGSSVPFAVNLSGAVTIGGSAAGAGYVDEFNGSIIAVATYNSRLTATEIQAHYNAFIKPAPPALNVTQTNDAVTVSWTATGSYTLLQTTDLSSGVWTTNTSATSLNGTTSLTVSPATGNMFFRLRQP